MIWITYIYFVTSLQAWKHNELEFMHSAYIYQNAASKHKRICEKVKPVNLGRRVGDERVEWELSLPM